MRDYERRDVSFPALGEAFAGLLLLLALAAAASLGTERFFARASSAAPRPSVAPPEPRLQADPAGDLARFRAEEDAALTSYGWVDRARGVIRVPIERASTLLLSRGLPTRAGATP